MVGGDDPLFLIFSVKLTPFLRNADFQSIFARSTSAVTASGKSSIITNMKSTSRFPMSLRLTSYVTLKPPEGVGLKNAKWPFSL